MADKKIRIFFFLEDIAHENFLTSIVKRISREERVQTELTVRNATGGKGRAISALRKFLKSEEARKCDLLIVCIDADCSTYSKKRRELEEMVEKRIFKEKLVCAIPEPHIERWYLSDIQALGKAIGGSVSLPSLGKKCRRDYYKRLLFQLIGNSIKVKPNLGGAEYGEDIARYMDFFHAGNKDSSFKHFIDDLRGKLRKGK